MRPELSLRKSKGERVRKGTIMNATLENVLVYPFQLMQSDLNLLVINNKEPFPNGGPMIVNEV